MRGKVRRVTAGLFAALALLSVAAVTGAKAAGAADGSGTEAADRGRTEAIEGTGTVLRDGEEAALLDGEEAVLYLDGAEISGAAAVSAGPHTVTARGMGAMLWIAVYVDGQFQDAAVNSALTYDFPERGAEIRLFRLDSACRPLGAAVRVVQAVAGQNLVYRGEAVCVPDAKKQFSEYTVQVTVVMKDGVMTEIRDIAGYDAPDMPTNGTNTVFLGMASAKVPDWILKAQSTEGIDAVASATCASEAIVRAVAAALETTPTVEDDAGSGGDETPVPDGMYSGSAQCLTGYMNYLADVDVTVADGIVTAVTDRTLRTPMSTTDRALYESAWHGMAERITGSSADGWKPVDAVTGATISSGAVNSAVADALKSRTAAVEETGTKYAPEGISLYSRVYPVVTVADGRMTAIRIVPVSGTDTAALEAFAETILARQSVTGLAWPTGIEDDAFAVANLIDQILYGTGVLS